MNRRILTVAGAMVTAVVLAATPALATESVKQTAKDGSAPPSGAPCSVGKGVTVCFQKAGDVIWVRDEQADGHHAVGGWGFGDGETDVWDYECHDYLGPSAGWTRCGWSDTIGESRTITFRGIEFDGSTPKLNGDAGPATGSKAS
jgi:hypothetical protein